MAVKTKDEPITISELKENRIITSSNKNALYFKGYSTFGSAVKSVTSSGNDLVFTLNDSTYSVILKDYFAKNGKFPVKYIKTDAETDNLTNILDYAIDNNIKGTSQTINTPAKKMTGTVFNDNISASQYRLYKDKDKKNIDYTYTKKGVTINANGGNDTIYGSWYSDTINGGDGGDTIYSSTGNDTISGGKGVNNLNYNSSSFGHDIVKLTKGETLNINSNYISSYAQGDTKSTKNDLVLKYNDNNTVTIKNYYAKDTGAVVNINGVDLTKTVKLAEVNASNYFDKEGQKAVRKYTGSALADKVDARGVEQLKDKNGNLLDTGVTLNTGLGDDVIYGSKYNDTITGGKGDNTIYHYAGEGDDTIVLTKGENLTIHLADIDKSNLTYSSDKKGNLIISYTQTISEAEKTGSIILKNFYKKDTTGADTYVKLITSDGTIDNMRTDLFLDTVKTSKNYTGSWLAENIVGQLEAPTNKKKNTGLTLNGGAGDDTITGTDYADTLTGGDGIDTIYGGKGDDTIKGGNGNDEIIGGEGDDFIYGEAGINKIYFKEADGKDTVYSGKGEDTLIFQDINLENVSVSNNKKDMVISYGDDDSVIVKNYYTVDKKGHITGINANNSVKHIDFGDSEDYNFIFNNEVNADIEGSSGSDLILATGGNNTITLYGGNDIVRLGAGDSTVKIDMSVIDSTVHEEGEEWEWTEYSENCTKTIYLNSDTSSTLTIDIDKEIFDGKALGVFCRGTGQDNDLYISLDSGMGYCIRVKNYFDENGDPKTDRVKLNVWEYPEQFSTELVQKQYTVPEWTDGSIWERVFDVQPFGEYKGEIHGKNIDNSWLLYSAGFNNNDTIYGGNGNKETIYIKGGKDIVYANEGNKNINISDNQSDCDIYLGKEKTTKTNINLGAVEGNVTSNIKSGDLEINWDCYADSDETTYTSKLRVDKWNEKTSQATIGISGNNRDNTLNAVDGVENIIDGGEGDDTLIGGNGVDTFNFIWSQGYDIDTVKDYTSDDIIRFESSSTVPVNFNEFKYYTNNNGKGLVINTKGLSGKENYVIIDNYFEADSKIDKVTTYNMASPDEEKSLSTMYGDKSALGSFDIGTGDKINGTETDDIIRIPNVDSALIVDGADGDDYIYSWNSNGNVIYGGNGNDELNIGGDNNTIYGGKGNDYISLSVESDEGESTNYTYNVVFNNGDGHDTLNADYSDVILNFADTLVNDITLEKLSNDLVIKYNDGADSVSIRNYFDEEYIEYRADYTIKDREGTETSLSEFITSYGEISEAIITEINGTETDDIIQIPHKTGITINGNDGDDYINGWEDMKSNKNIINGGNGNDEIVIEGEKNTISGGKGNDYVQLSGSTNNLIFNNGDGDDFINLNDGNAVFEFTETAISNLSLERFGDNLVIKYSDSDSVTVRDYYSEDWNDEYMSVTLKDSEGTMDLTDYVNDYVNDYGEVPISENDKILGTTSDDHIRVPKVEGLSVYGNEGDDTVRAIGVNGNYIYGGSGNDKLVIYGNNNTIFGEIGNDYIDIYGEEESVNYTNNLVFNNGDGRDTVDAYYGKVNLNFADTLTTDITLEKLSNDLVIKYNDGADSVSIRNYFDEDYTEDRADYTIKDSEGTETSLSEFISSYGKIYDSNIFGTNGTDNEDVFIAKSGENTYIGGKGDDSLTSQGGKTTFVFNDGDGSDTLYQKGGEITLKFNDATIEELSSPTGYDRDAKGYYSDLLIHYDGNENTLRVKDYFYKNYVTKIIDSTGTEYNMADYFKRVEYIDSISYTRTYSNKMRT